VGAFDVASYCALAARADLADLTGSSAIVCDAVVGGDDEALPHCRVLVADEGGRVMETGLEGVVAALRAADGRFVVLTEDERLVLHDGRQEIRQLAAWAAEPTLDHAGRRVAFVAAPPGVERAELGEPTRLVVLDLEQNRLRVVTDDASASAPLFVPDGTALLYVSTAGEVASVVRVELATGAATPLTNVGLVDVGQGFVPIYERQLAWSGAHTLVFAATTGDDVSELWALDARTGDAHRVGEGLFPLGTEDGRVVVADPSSSRCPVELSLEVTP
jgi:Tol biopolymer transport system component